MLTEPWRIQLFGDLRAVQGEQHIKRFRAQKYGLLLAYLAYYCRRSHPREELVTLLWPDAEPEAGRLNLRVALTSLRKQLEPPGIPRGSVLVTEGDALRLHPDAFQTDVQVFATALRAAEQTPDLTECRDHLILAVDVYQGRLLPGFYEDWVSVEQSRLEERYRQALHRLIETLEQLGDLAQALDYAHRAVGLDPLDEAGHQFLIRLYLRGGQPAAAHRQFKELERLLREQLGAKPSLETGRLLEVTDSSGTTASLPTEPGSKQRPTQPRRSPASAVSAKPSPAFCLLPPTLNRFFGREAELSALEDRLADTRNRLVTILGTGGAGKTRLAIEAARHFANSASSAVAFVSLSGTIDPQFIPETICGVLRLPPTPRILPIEQVIDSLLTVETAQRERVLLVLDNLEHLLAADATRMVEIVQTFLTRLPGLTLLVTSRQALLLAGEVRFPLSSLPVPTLTGTPARLREFAGIQLFVERAQLVRPDFQITTRNVAAVTELCRRLDGLPLAIELAAAWAQTLTPSQMLERMANRFQMLVSRQRDAAPRHRSLHAAIASSYALLPPEAQRLFCQLSVFRGGFTLEAAQEVCSAAEVEQADAHIIERTLTLLQDHSLVAVEESEGTLRFSMLETLREFADEQWGAEARSEARHRHGVWFHKLARTAEDAMRGSQQASWLTRLTLDNDNIQAALNYGIESGDAEFSQELAGSLWGYWERRGLMTEARRSLQDALALCGEPKSPSRAKALSRLGAVLNALGETEQAARVHGETLALCTALEDTKGIALAWNRLGVVAHWRGRFDEAQASFEAALALEKQLGNAFNTGSALAALGILALAQGSYAEAERWFLEALEQYQALNIPGCIAECLLNLAAVHIDRGELETATGFLHRAAALNDELGDRWSRSYTVLSLAVIARHRRQWSEAARLAEETLTTCREFNDQPQIAGALSELGILAHCTGDHQQAATCLREALALYRRFGYRTNLAWCLRELGAVALAQSTPVLAARLLGAAEAWRERVRRPLSSVEQPRYDEDVLKVYAALGNRAFRQHWAGGRAMTEDDALTEALRC